MISHRPPSVWIDDSHAIVRRGMAACLQQADFVVRGESAVLSPEPVLTGLDLLVFEYAAPTLRRAVRLAEGGSTRLVATVRETTEQAVREMSRMSLMNTVQSIFQGFGQMPKPDQD